MKKHAMILAGIICLFCLAVNASELLTLPFNQRFDKPLDGSWKTDVSKDNKIEVIDNALRISAGANTYAHIERSLGVDLFRAECVLKPNGGISWATSLFLYWDPQNWCQITVLDKDSCYYSARLIDGKLVDRRFSFNGSADWHRVAIELGEECVRFQGCKDGGDWVDLPIVPRSGSWMGKPPALLVIGKGFSRSEGKQHFSAVSLNNDYTSRGPATVSLVREISIKRLAPERTRITEAEKKVFVEQGKDSLGEQELAGGKDPSFASVSSYFPPMKSPREAVGAKDGPQEFVVMPDGSFDFAGVKAWFAVGNSSTQLISAECAKHLLEGYLPIVVAEWEKEGLKYQQKAAGWSPEMNSDTPLAALVQLRISNPGTQNRKVDVQFVVKNPVMTWNLEIPAQGEQSVYVNIPFAKPAEAVKNDAADFEKRFSEVTAFWKKLLAKGMKVTVPEQRINDACRAWLAYNFIDVDKRNGVYEPHDGGGGFYEEIYGYSASRYCYALDLWGHHAEARQYLDSILSFVKPDGLLVLHYGLPDTGAQLWAMGKHYRMTGDTEWLRKVAPTMIKMCNWIIAERKSSMAQQAKDASWYGLIKYRPYADEPAPTYSYHTDTYLLLGLEETAAALRDAGMTDEAARITTESEAYRRDILNSMDKAVLERFGMKMLPVFPETHALLERVGYSGADYYSLISCMVLETDVLPANDHRARLITDLLQQRKGLCLGVCAFGEGIDHAYSYGYWMNCLQRDEVQRVILGLYASLAYGMSRDTYSSVEVTGLRSGANQKTLPHLYSATQQLLLLRNMLIREAGDTLILGQAIPRPWLEDGKKVCVEDAPTLFGNVGYSIKSHDGAQKMTVRIDPPKKKLPKVINIRLRHPANKAIQGVTINGIASKEFTNDMITLTKVDAPVTIEVHY
ncbi:MAG: hypothetical protein PHR77_01780 [Kiritimatiellae bacterium]|nr:hypothetical protein [Kiritimatiellia bacterium]MDD5522449.1 hypothetical protein [Kiritimatiellia bacterium]